MKCNYTNISVSKFFWGVWRHLTSLPHVTLNQVFSPTTSLPPNASDILFAWHQLKPQKISTVLLSHFHCNYCKLNTQLGFLRTYYRAGTWLNEVKMMRYSLNARQIGILDYMELTFITHISLWNVLMSFSIDDLMIYDSVFGQFLSRSII